MDNLNNILSILASKKLYYSILVTTEDPDKFFRLDANELTDLKQKEFELELIKLIKFYLLSQTEDRIDYLLNNK